MNPVETNAPGVTSSQGRVLGILRNQGRAVTLAELVEATGLHVNTLRGHLDGLVDQHRVSRIAVRRRGPGRPAWGYLAREPEYAALALALAEGLDDHQGERLELAPGRALGHSDSAALRGGRAWGERLRTQLPLEGSPSALDRLFLALDHTGFEPERGAEGELRLRACPLLDAARAHPGVVCAAHLGLIEGVLGGPGADLLPRPATLGCTVRLP